MLETSKLKTISITDDDRRQLWKEFEDIFIAANGTVESYYSLVEVGRKYPKIAELFKIISTGS